MSEESKEQDGNGEHKHHKPPQIHVDTGQIDVSGIQAEAEALGAESLEDRIAPSVIGGGMIEGAEDLPEEDPMAGDPEPGDDYTGDPEPGDDYTGDPPPPEGDPNAPPEEPPPPIPPV